MEEEYEILPHQELEYLRKEVERIKKNPFGDTETGQTLLDAMNNLTASVNKLNEILTTANDEMIKDYHENKTSERLSKVVEQNEKLAQGIVALGELIKDVLKLERKNSALSGGFSDISTFATDVKQTHHHEKHSNNPFQEAKLHPEESIKLDTNLPRHDELPPAFGENKKTEEKNNLPPINDSEIPKPGGI